MNALFFAVLCLIWGSTWMAIKINLSYFPPFYSAGLRFLLAGSFIGFAGILLLFSETLAEFSSAKLAG